MGLGPYCFDRNYVPSVGWDYVGGYEIQVVMRVGDPVGGHVALVRCVTLIAGGFYLDSADVAIVLDH